jgi:predicted metal-dependent hydrolase
MRLQDLSVDMLSEYGEDDECAARYRKEVELYIRYQASHDRALQRYAAELRKFQSEKKKAEIGFESQKREQAEETRRQERHHVAIAIQKARLHKLTAPSTPAALHELLDNLAEQRAPALQIAETRLAMTQIPEPQSPTSSEPHELAA